MPAKQVVSAMLNANKWAWILPPGFKGDPVAQLRGQSASVHMQVV